MRTRHFVLISAAMLLVTGLVGVGLGQSRDRSLANLTLELAAAKNQFVQLEPIPVVITLQNDTWGFIRAHEALGFDSNLIDLFVGVEGQPMKKIEDQSVTRDAVASPKRFYPGERRQQAETLTFGLDRMFPQPGHYRMQAVLRSIDEREQIISSVITFEVARPEGSDLEAFEYIKSVMQPSYFYGWLGATRGGPNEDFIVADFMSRFGRTTYGDHLAYVYGRIYFAKGRYEKSVEMYRRLVDRKALGRGDEVLYRLIEAEGWLGNSEEQKHYLTILQSQYPNSTFSHRAKAVVSEGLKMRD